LYNTRKKVLLENVCVARIAQEYDREKKVQECEGLRLHVKLNRHCIFFSEKKERRFEKSIERECSQKGRIDLLSKNDNLLIARCTIRNKNPVVSKSRIKLIFH